MVSLVLATGCGWGDKGKKEGREPTAIGSSAGRFVGSEACRSCHAPAFEAWSKSRHRSTLRPWAPGTPLRSASTGKDGRFVLAADGKASGPGADGQTVTGTVAFLIGGRHREDVVVKLPDGRQQIFPISFDADRGAAFSPIVQLAGGNEPPPDTVDFWTRAGRNADLACYGCHATGQILEVAARSPEGLALPASRFVEPGVGCEGCHGPGGAHVDAAEGGRSSRALVRLAKGTDGPTAVATCASCHALREVLPSPFSTAPAHRYGEPLPTGADPVLSVASNFEFREPFFEDFRPATFQQEATAFGQTGCATRGGMTCASCHDPHSGEGVPALRAADGGDSICSPCHEPIFRAREEHVGRAAAQAGGRCLDCHMAPSVRGPGSHAARDHSFTAPGDRRRAELARDVAAARGRRREGIEALARRVTEPKTPWFVRWGSLQLLTPPLPGPVPDMAREAAQGALSDPDPAIRRAAARALGRIGDARDAEAVQRATSDPDPWTALDAARALASLQIPTAGGRLLQLLKRPDLVADARAQYAYGHACLVGQDHVRAEKALRQALAIHPYLLPAMNDLGLALVGQKRDDEARLVWKAALDVNPRFSSARDNLEQLDAQPRENQRESRER